jgi:aspartyl-tRNA(Asn)/glutamyl-tRNA(Gln) amidotransferase subunit C
MAVPPVIDRSQLQHLAELARLHVPADRQATVLQHMQRVVDAFEALRQLPVAPPAPTGGGEPLRLRDDVPEPPLPVPEVLANAPRTAGSMFVVPRVVEG